MAKKFLTLVTFIIFAMFIFVCQSNAETKSFDNEIESTWHFYQKVVQLYSGWQNNQEIEFEDINRIWYQNNLTSLLEPVTKTDKIEFRKGIFPKEGSYSLTLVTDYRNQTFASVFSPIFLVSVKKIFDSKVDVVDLYSDKISGGIFNTNAKRLESLSSFFKKNINKEGFCSIAWQLLLLKKPDFIKRQDGRWQLRLNSFATVSCPFMEREKTFEKTTYLNLPYSMQIDYSKIDDDKYVNIAESIQPVPIVIDILLSNDIINWLKKEMHSFGLKN